MTRVRLPTDRQGHVHKLKIGAASVYVVVNCDEQGRPMECFGFGDEGIKPEMDGLCGLTSIALQHGTPLEKIIKFLRFRRYEPSGIAGQPLSVSDALGLVLEGYKKEEA